MTPSLSANWAGESLKLTGLDAELPRMGAPSTFDPLASGAYALFVTELGRQLVRVRALLAEETPLRGERLRELMKTCHTIKGGAGFFGLVELMSAAGQLETIFLAEEVTVSGEVVELLGRLENLSQRIPAPTKGATRCPTS